METIALEDVGDDDIVRPRWGRRRGRRCWASDASPDPIGADLRVRTLGLGRRAR